MNRTSADAASTHTVFPVSIVGTSSPSLLPQRSATGWRKNGPTSKVCEQLLRCDRHGVPQRAERRGVREVEIEHLLRVEAAVQRGRDHVNALARALATHDLRAEQPAGPLL